MTQRASLQPLLFIACLALATACGLETGPNPNPPAGSGSPGGEGGGGEGATSGGVGGSTGGSGGSGGTGAIDGGGSGGMTGGVGGATGGSGGDGSAATCERDSECSAALPQCNSNGECAPCTGQSACNGRDDKGHCVLSSSSTHHGECVACTQNGHCTEGDANVCVENVCVECEDNDDCPASKPQCGADHTCGACTDETACSDRNATPHCMTAAGAQHGQCVECVTHSQCDADEPECKNNHQCGACTGEEACEGREETPHCNVTAGLETTGLCVECTGATEEDDCDGKSCKRTTGECTGTDTDSVDPCESCEADSECKTGSKCVTQTLLSTALGAFCFLESATNDGCANTRPSVNPYSVVASTVSIDGASADYCLPPTSCRALDDASSAPTLGALDCTMSAQCGVTDLADGLCAEAGTAAGKCTYSCTENYECPDDLPTCEDPPGNFCRP